MALDFPKLSIHEVNENQSGELRTLLSKLETLHEAIYSTVEKLEQKSELRLRNSQSLLQLTTSPFDQRCAIILEDLNRLNLDLQSEIDVKKSGEILMKMESLGREIERESTKESEVTEMELKKVQDQFERRRREQKKEDSVWAARAQEAQSKISSSLQCFDAEFVNALLESDRQFSLMLENRRLTESESVSAAETAANENFELREKQLQDELDDLRKLKQNELWESILAPEGYPMSGKDSRIKEHFEKLLQTEKVLTELEHTLTDILITQRKLESKIKFLSIDERKLINKIEIKMLDRSNMAPKKKPVLSMKKPNKNSDFISKQNYEEAKKVMKHELRERNLKANELIGELRKYELDPQDPVFDELTAVARSASPF